MRTVDAVLGKPIELNKTGTNETTVIRFRVRQWMEAYPGCVITLIHRRAEDEKGLPVSGFTVDQDTGMGLWTVSNADTAFPGGGECELIMDLGTKKAKSPTYFTMTVPSVGDQSEEPPEPYEGWVDMVVGKAAVAVTAAEDAEEAKEEAENAKEGAVEAKNDAENAAQRAETASGHGPYIGENRHWYVWDSETGVYVDTNVVAEGVDGDDGISPEVTFAQIAGGHSMTVKDAEHPDGQTINIMDGEDGENPVVDLYLTEEQAEAMADGGEATMTNEQKAIIATHPKFLAIHNPFVEIMSVYTLSCEPVEMVSFDYTNVDISGNIDTYIFVPSESRITNSWRRPPLIDDDYAMPDSVWSGRKTKNEIDAVWQDVDDLGESVSQLNQAIDTLPTSETGEEWANKEELNTELVGQFVGEVDRMFSTGLPQESTMGRVIAQLSLGNGLLNDLYLGMGVS